MQEKQSDQEIASLKKQLAELAASEARLRTALIAMTKAAFAIVQHNANEIKLCNEADSLAEQALSTPPSEALKPWVELAKNSESFGEFAHFNWSDLFHDAVSSCRGCQLREQARQLLQQHGYEQSNITRRPRRI